MSVQSEENEPNKFGFAGEGTAPEPEQTTERPDQVNGEDIAIPADDLTGSITAATEQATDRDES